MSSYINGLFYAGRRAYCSQLSFGIVKILSAGGAAVTAAEAKCVSIAHITSR
jgi:hypothetical protein